MLKTINTLINGGYVQQGTLTKMFKLGFISGKIIFYYDIYSFYNNKLQEGYEKTTAITLTADKYKISERTVYRTFDKMKESEDDKYEDDESE